MGLEFIRRGHQATIITKKEPSVPYHAIYDKHGKPLNYLVDNRPVLSVLAFESNGQGVFRTNRKLSDFLGFSGWDVVVLYGQNVWLTDEVWRDIGWWRKCTSRAKIVYLPIGFLGLERQFPLPIKFRHLLYYHVIQDHIIEQADITVALTDREVQQIPKIGRPRRLVKIPNGVDYPRFQDYTNDGFVRDRFNLPDGPLIINVGGDYSNKRLQDACLGVASLNRVRSGRCALVLLGPGTERYSNSWVHGLGEISEADKIALYHEAAVMLHTSDFEGFGVVYLEALASGLPFVSTPVGAAPELAPQFGGHLVWQRSPEAIAYHLMNELQEERDQDELRAIAARYDWPKVIDQFEEVVRWRQNKDEEEVVS